MKMNEVYYDEQQVMKMNEVCYAKHRAEEEGEAPHTAALDE